MKKKHFNATKKATNIVQIRAVKLFLFFALFIAGTGQISASIANQDVKISLTGQEHTVGSILSAIASQTKFKVFYNNTQLDVNRRVTTDMNNRPVREILAKLLKGTGYTYEIDKKQIVIVAEKATKSQEKPRKLHGVVKDSNGETLPGVSVLLKGTNIGVATDISGKYTFEIPKSAGILLFSFVGMKTQEVEIGARKEINVILEEDNELLDEVIVTGYQKLNVNQAAGSFNKVDMETFEKKISPDISSVLEGLSPSLVVSSKPGSSSKELTIRGISTLQGASSPLIIVDGFPYSDGLSSINPYDIEGITLLKDAASASIYGAKSANGVIVITTKRGKRGNLEIRYTNTLQFEEKPDINYVMNRVSSSEMVDIETDYFNQNKDNLHSYQHYVEKGDYYAYNHIGTRNKVVQLHIAHKEGKITEGELNAKLQKLRNTDNSSDLEKLLLQNPFYQQHDLSASYGGEEFKLRTSLNYFDSKTGFKGSDSEGLRYSLSSLIELSEKLKLDLSANFNLNKGKDNKEVPSSFFRLSPYERLYDEQGNALSVTKTGSGLVNSNNGGRFGGKDNYAIEQMKKQGLLDETYIPASDYGLSQKKAESWSARFQAQMKMHILSGLEGTFAFNLKKRSYSSRTLTHKNSWEMRSLINNLTEKKEDGTKGKLNIPLGGRMEESRSDLTTYLLRGQLDYSKRINNHEIIALLGSEIQSSKTVGTTVDRFGYDDISNTYREVDNFSLKEKDITNVFQPGGYVAGGVPLNNSFSEIENRFFSLYSNLNYLYSDRYIFSASMRIDQSNLFGTDPKYRFKPFWSLGGKWRISEEPFFASNFFSKLDMQISYGTNGNISNKYGPYDIATDGFFFRADNARGLQISSYAVKDLRWESTHIFNIGLHSHMLNDRVFMSLDYYRKHTKDVLAERKKDPTGATYFEMANDATILNDGYEFAISSTNIKTENFSWSTFLNLSYNKSKVDKIFEQELAATSIAGAIKNRLGYETNSVFVFDWAGVDKKGNGLIRRNNGDLIAISPTKNEGGTFDLTDLKKVDLIHAGTILPKTTAGLTNNFKYKNFSLSFMFVYQGGHILVKDSYNGAVGVGSRFDLVNKEASKAWKKPGDELITDVPRLASASYYQVAQNSSKNITEGDFIRLRDVVLSYTLPNHLLSSIGLKEVTLNLRGKNLFLWTKNPYNIDPETQGLGYRDFPVAKSVSAAISITF